MSPTNTYKNVSNLTCLICDLTCRSCLTSGSDQCLSCSNNLYLQTSPEPSPCLITCPAKTFKSDINQTCLPCDLSCLTCIGAGSTQCLTCHIGKYLDNKLKLLNAKIFVKMENILIMTLGYVNLLMFHALVAQIQVLIIA